jgi:hypothetical protein
MIRTAISALLAAMTLLNGFLIKSPGVASLLPFVVGASADDLSGEEVTCSDTSTAVDDRSEGEGVLSKANGWNPFVIGLAARQANPRIAVLLIFIFFSSLKKNEKRE